MLFSMADSAASLPGGQFAASRPKGRALLELGVAYGLILAVIWTPRPWQKALWWIAAAAVLAITAISFEGLTAMGLRGRNFFPSLWVAGAALAAAGVALAVAARLHTLHLPASPLRFIATYWAYALWAMVQQFLLQCFFLARLRRIVAGEFKPAAAAAGIFAAAHLPNPILTPITLLWGMGACMVFLRYRNLYPLGIAHAILGISIALTVPGNLDHNMRVGLSYINYSPKPTPVAHPASFKPPSPLQQPSALPQP